MPNNLVLFTSGGREYAACPVPEGYKPEIYEPHTLVFVNEITESGPYIDLPEGNWTIMGRLNELVAKFNSEVDKKQTLLELNADFIQLGQLVCALIEVRASFTPEQKKDGSLLILFKQ